MTEMDGQNRKVRRRRARWGPEAGDEPQSQTAAQPRQAASPLQSNAGEPNLASIGPDRHVCHTCKGRTRIPTVVPAYWAGMAQCIQQCTPFQAELALNEDLKNPTGCCACRGGCCGRGRRVAAGCHCCTISRRRWRAPCWPQEAAGQTHTLGTRGCCHS